MPRFSIIVPAYNAESTLAETLAAVEAQTLADWECVVVNDGSSDGTALVCTSFTQRDQRFVLHSQRNQGTSGAYNTGVKRSVGDLIVICSADDLLLPNHLATMSDLIDRHPEFGIFSCNGAWLYESGSRVPVYSRPKWASERSLSLEQVMESCFYSVGASYRREVFDLVGGYRDAYGEDYDFWLRAMASGARHRYTPDILSLHRISDYQKSADKRRLLESDIRSLSDLMGSGLLSPRQTRVARTSIRRRRIIMASQSSRIAPLLGLWRKLWTLLGRMGIG